MRKQKLEFSIPEKYFKLEIIGKPKKDHDSEKSGRRLYDILRSFLPGSTYRSFERNLVADLLSASCETTDLQRLKNKIYDKANHLPYAPKVFNFYEALEKAIEKKRVEANNIFSSK